MNLPDLYARVCAVRPELAVKSLARDLSVYSDDMLDPDGPIADSILAKWIKALPEGMCLARVQMTHSGEAWIVAQDMNDDTSAFIGPNPIEALAAFYLGET